MANTAGIDCTWNAWLMAGFSAMLTLASTTLPSVAAVTRSRIGLMVVQGPHHGAHRSTTTAVCIERSMTSLWKVASVTSMAMHPRLSTLPGSDDCALPAGRDRSAASQLGLDCRGGGFDRPAEWLGNERGDGLHLGARH